MCFFLLQTRWKGFRCMLLRNILSVYILLLCLVNSLFISHCWGFPFLFARRSKWCSKRAHLKLEYLTAWRDFKSTFFTLIKDKLVCVCDLIQFFFNISYSRILSFCAISYTYLRLIIEQLRVFWIVRSIKFSNIQNLHSTCTCKIRLFAVIVR